MDTNKSLKKKIIVSMVSAAASVLISYVATKIRSRVLEKKNFKQKDRELNRALIASMDCSDPVAKY